MSGWLKLHRGATEKDLVQNVFLWGLWHWLLQVANWKESQIIWEGTQRILKPGQLLFKIREISNQWDCSPATIWKWLHYLQKTQRIAIESRTHGTIVTICNWEIYQAYEESERTPSEHEVNTERTPSELYKEVQEEKKNTIRVSGGVKNPKRKAGIRIQYPAEFEEVWSTYGLKGDKKASLLEFESLNLSPEDRSNLKTAIRSYLIKTPDKKFRKDFERFLKMDWRQFIPVYNIASGPRILSKEEIEARVLTMNQNAKERHL